MQTNGRIDGRTDDRGHNIIRPFGRIEMKIKVMFTTNSLDIFKATVKETDQSVFSWLGYYQTNKPHQDFGRF